MSLNNLAELFRTQGRYSEAEPLYKRSLAIREKALGPVHPSVGTSLNNLAALAYHQNDWAVAVSYLRRSTGVIRHRAERGLAGGREETSAEEAKVRRSEFLALLKATDRLAGQGLGPTAPLAAEMFEVARWAQGSEAATSLAQMAARSAKGLPQLAGVVRERQDLVSEWQTKDKQLIAAKSEPPARRKANAEKALAERLAAIDTRLAEIARRLAQDFPDHAALANPSPVSLAEVRTQLGSDEALVLFLDTDGRIQTAARGDLHLGSNQNRSALGPVSPWHGGARPRSNGTALRARLCGVGRRGCRAVRQATRGSYSKVDVILGEPLPWISPARTSFTGRCSDRWRI